MQRKSPSQFKHSAQMGLYGFVTCQITVYTPLDHVSATPARVLLPLHLALTQHLRQLREEPLVPLDGALELSESQNKAEICWKLLLLRGVESKRSLGNCRQAKTTWNICTAVRTLEPQVGLTVMPALCY